MEITLIHVKGNPPGPSPYRVGQQYSTQDGEVVQFVRVHNEGTSYETMEDHRGHNRYTRRDFGRITGSAHDYSHPGNVPPPAHSR